MSIKIKIATPATPYSSAPVIRPVPGLGAIAPKPITATTAIPLPLTLKGMGFTKKLAAKLDTAARRADVAIDKAIDAALAPHQQELLVEPSPIAAVVANILHTILPSTLMGDVILDDSQAHAVNELVKWQFGCIIGAAGTGKTTTVKALVARLLKLYDNLSITFVAFTGRSVQQIKRALPAEFQMYCDTLHGLLEYAPESQERTDPTTGNTRVIRVFSPRRTAANRLTQNVIIVDEGGMVPPYLWNNMFDAIKSGTRVYLLGDINQLPPVQGRSVLGFAMLSWPTFELNRIWRTNEDDIVSGAWDILHGKMPKAGRCCALQRVSDNSIEANQHLRAVIQKLHKSGHFDPMLDAIIVPQNVGGIGQEELNRSLVEYFNPPTRDPVSNAVLNPRTVIISGMSRRALAVGDKLMITKNDREQGLTNGMIGVITEITINTAYRGERVGALSAADLQSQADFSLDSDELNAAINLAEEHENDDETDTERQASHIVTITFQNLDTPVEFSTAGAFRDIQHAYAFTCHKAQGGEYRNVIVLVHSANSRMLCREWLYTAWTRAKERVILVYNTRGLQQALTTQRIVGETLEAKAKAFNRIQEANKLAGDDAKLPMLPQPELMEAA